MGIADTFDPELNLTAGYLLSGDDPAKPLGEDGKRLLHLIYWLTYTKDGRTFLTQHYPSKENPLPPGRMSEQAATAALRAKFTADFNLNDETVLNACIQLHFQATYWVDENKKFGAGDADALARRDVHEANYKTYLSVITWQLWEDGTGHEFSLGW